jgi:hypothetical protein
MGFLHSDSIVLDAVLTDTGRMRLAKGDGTFRIQRFAFGDDEIDYHLYDIDNSGGEAYYPLTILETPVLEAFSNNASSMKSRLMSLTRTDLLYLPILKLYDTGDSARFSDPNMFIVAVDEDTADALLSDRVLPLGILNGWQPGMSTHHVRVDQGIDNANVQILDGDLRETQYLVEMDNRLGSLISPIGNNPGGASVSFVDDDQIATYPLSLDTDKSYVTEISQNILGQGQTQLLGAPGSKVQFRVSAKSSLRTNNTLFTKLGKSATINTVAGLIIDSIISVTGLNTGHRMSIPVRYFKKS